ncbi:MAG: hypothetical protein BGN92_14030 [Sphingobacteriales bacterium 41-5]|nr:MAG: hypothetical protein BGN92_14030 [Sphingobacteriales bacterium 41-5]
MLKYLIIILVLFSCSPKLSQKTARSSGRLITGSEFYQEAIQMQWKQRDSFAVTRITAGNFPSFLRKLKKVNVSMLDSTSGKTIKASYFVTPDYLSIGTNKDWARIPLTPIAAQQLADAFNCFLPTTKIVDDIYKTARVKLEPVPMYIYRDSTVTMWQHHLIIEGQRRNRKGLIAGIKKDVVISRKIGRSEKPNRVAIYGWHLMNGKPIQPLYTGHVNWYADYSHGIRLVYRKIKVNGKWMDYVDVLSDPVLRKLICNEEYCDFYRY